MAIVRIIDNAFHQCDITRARARVPARVILYSVAKGGRMRNVEMAPSLSPTCSAYHSLYIVLHTFRGEANSLSQSYVAIRYVKYLRTIKNCISNYEINYAR
jgi:hypothetical protein